jgi:predicted nucleic-acid-binding Zn-ribbon protein
VKNGKCPKCGSDKVFHGAEIPAKFGPFGSNSIPITLLSIASLDNYVCAECGYLERFVAEATKLKEISIKWPKVKAEASS